MYEYIYVHKHVHMQQHKWKHKRGQVTVSHINHDESVKSESLKKHLLALNQSINPPLQELDAVTIKLAPSITDDDDDD